MQRKQKEIRVTENRRPLSANPKHIVMGTQNRPESGAAQYNRKRPTQNQSQKDLPVENKENNYTHNSEEMEEYDALNIQEISEEGGPNFEEFDKDGHSYSQKIFNSRPTTATIFKKNAEFDLPFPELFDRSERTFAATYAKFGDLSYYTPIQRIGNYMDFGSRLKKKHLMDIIQYLKTSKHILKAEDDESTENFFENCLFIGLMPDEDHPPEIDEEEAAIQARYKQNDLENEDEKYDPALFMFEGAGTYDQVWSDALLR